MQFSELQYISDDFLSLGSKAWLLEANNFLYERVAVKFEDQTLLSWLATARDNVVFNFK